jgi:hypothetical protein
LPYALGRSDGQSATLFITSQPGCSSLLKPNVDFISAFPYSSSFAINRTLPVTLMSMDTVCALHDVHPDVIKIDVQGYELAILQGGRSTVRGACLVELEVEFNPLYEGQPLFGDVDAEMRQQGYALLGLRRTAWRRVYDGPSAGGTIVHGDALYSREPLDAEQRARFIQALIAYRQLDYARSLGAAIPSMSHHRSLPQRIIGTVIKRWRPHRELRAWLDNARPAGARDWHDPDFY